MNTKQQQWLLARAKLIPRLFDAIKDGDTEASVEMGERTINGRNVRLSLIAEVVDPGRDPLKSHASVNYPTTHTGELPENMVTPKPRNRNCAKRGKL